MTPGRAADRIPLRPARLLHAIASASFVTVLGKRGSNDGEDPMRDRCLAAFATVTGIALVALTPLFVAAQSTSTAEPPRTPWGHPDLQGVWDFSTITPLERPDELAGKEYWTEEEAADLEQQALDRIQRDARPSVVRTEPLPVTGSVGAYNLFWFGPNSDVVESRRTSLVIDPPDGKIPWTPEGIERRDARAARNERLAHGPEDRTIAERCILGFNSGRRSFPSATTRKSSSSRLPTTWSS